VTSENIPKLPMPQLALELDHSPVSPPSPAARVGSGAIALGQLVSHPPESHLWPPAVSCRTLSLPRSPSETPMLGSPNSTIMPLMKGLVELKSWNCCF